MASIAYKFETHSPAQHEGVKLSSPLDVPVNLSALLPGNEDEVLTALSAPSLTNVIMTSALTSAMVERGYDTIPPR